MSKQETPEQFRERIGRRVRTTWVRYCKKTGRIEKPSHIAPWWEISEWDREVDRRIGSAVYREALRDVIAGLRLLQNNPHDQVSAFIRHIEHFAASLDIDLTESES